MAFILGMDTGGTYTDGVIIDPSQRNILCKAKALTTKDDLTRGIKNCMENLEFDRMEEITQVSLSTTLATNAIVEGRGARVGLIYMGAELEEPVPAAVAVKIKGRFDIMGRLLEDLDPQELRSALAQMKGSVEAVAVSGYASVRNPKHEKQVAHMARELLDIPVVCAHQLTSALGFHHRTVTAVLNGGLIPIISRLLSSTREVLREKKIDAQILIVKGDGALMTEEMAKERPIETILSGPAASVIGSLALTGRKEGLVLDMGGTTTDIANVSEGTVKIKKEGARVGGWLTRVQAAEMCTFGLGGDSRICLDEKGNLQIGPRKVWPLSLIGAQYPQLVHELKSFSRVGEYKRYFEQEADCFLLGSGSLSANASEQEKKIVRLLQDRPHSLTYLARQLGMDPETLDLTGLTETGVLERIAVTPTDLLHVQGTYTRWNRDTALAGIQILARRKEMSVSKFVTMARRAINEKMAMCCLQSAADFEGREFSLADSPQAMYLIEKTLRPRSGELLQSRVCIGKPIVAIGAPAAAWACEAGNMLGTEVIVPENADVANAYGAAAGQITETIELLISKDKNRYILNAPWERIVCESKDEAVFYAVHEGRKYIEHLLRDAGCRKWTIRETSSDILADVAGEDGTARTSSMGTKFVISGTGFPL